jgi:multidrug transporter EmrE-like cation transporter
MSRLLNPYAQLFLTVVFITAGEVFLKQGASTTPPGTADWLGSASLGSDRVWIGIAFLCASAITWVFVLRSMPLYLAFTICSAVHVTIPVCSWLFLGEKINTGRGAGIALVIAGIWIIARPASRIEERV